MKEFLDSDRLNFLLWRYLLEGNYRETAAKFQKEWRVQQPHRQFDFAPHVKNHALVSVVNRGLIYHSLEREFAQSQQAPQDGPGAVGDVPHGVFGPLIVQPPPQQHRKHQQASVAPDPAAASALPSSHAAASLAAAVASGEEDAEGEADADGDVDVDADADGDADATGEDDDIMPTVEEIDNSRKRQIQQPSNGSPVKRPRLLNGHENGVVADSTATAMDIDDNNHAYPSPLEVEPVASPPPRTYGLEQGTQVEKVDELTPETIFLSMTAEDGPAAAAAASGAVLPATPPTDSTPSRTQHNPILLHCEWNPSDPSVLAACGTDALARIWTVSRLPAPAPTPGHGPDHVSNQPFDNLIEDDASPNSVVTAMAWNWDGTALAVATDSGSKARVSVWAQDGTNLQRFDLAEPPIIKLKWNPNNSSILAISPDNEGALAMVFESEMLNTVSYNLPTHDLESNPLDAAWISEKEFLLCGGKLLESFKYTDQGITSSRKFPTREDDCFTQVQFDWRSRLVATASESGLIDLWDESGQRRSIPAHSGPITSLTWQPLQGNPPDDERLLASGGEDGIISIWNARQPENKAKWSMTMDPPVVALSFTPDGAFIAGATTDRILIWKVGEYAIPRASWSRTAHPGWLAPKPMNGMSSSIEDTHCLCWDASGQKLAYGTNSLIAVINFR